MQYSETLKDIKKGSFRPIYIIDSSELFFREEIFGALKERFCEDEEANVLSFNAAESRHGDIIDELTTESLFSPKQIIKVTEGFGFLSENTDWFSEYTAQQDALQELAFVLFVEDDFSAYPKTKALGETKKLLNKLDRKYDIFVKIPKVKKYKIPSWLVSRAAREYGITIGSNEAARIVENTGTELKRIDMELDKIATFILPRTLVESEDVEQLCLFNRENTIFEMLDAVSAGNISMSLIYMKQLLFTGTRPVHAVYMIFWHIKKLMTASLMMSRNISQKEILSATGTNAYFKKKFFDQVNRYRPEQLMSAMQLAQRADSLCKTGSDEKRTLERLITILCTRGQDAATRLL